MELGSGPLYPTAVSVTLQFRVVLRLRLCASCLQPLNVHMDVDTVQFLPKVTAASSFNIHQNK